jgi:hypothetical protein
VNQTLSRLAQTSPSKSPRQFPGNTRKLVIVFPQFTISREVDGDCRRDWCVEHVGTLCSKT